MPGSRAAAAVLEVPVMTATVYPFPPPDRHVPGCRCARCELSAAFDQLERRLIERIDEHVRTRPQLYRIPDVAKLLSLSESKVRELIDRGDLETVRLEERMVRIPARAVDQFVASVTERGQR